MTNDRWSQWLLTRRDGDSEPIRAQNAVSLAAFRDGVLARAALRPDDVVLDVGCGTGLIGFAALERLGPAGQVIFTDISDDLLDECRRTAGDDPRASFVRAGADDLTGIEDASVDVVTMRSVLLYSDRKEAAFHEFFRVLRPGGRLSLFEPINRFLVEHGPHRMFGLPDSPVDDLLRKISLVYFDAGSAAASQTIVDFDERDLLAWADAAGFDAIELDYRAELRALADPIVDWEGLKRTAPNPLAPTYGDVIAGVLTAEEQRRLDTYMRGLAEAATPTRRTLGMAFLAARRP
ncbi:class I SAM-dependent methyltransferase [Actinoplanes sp. NPDC051343]|uniref:class I SAM-dependent methyltransferase n=1 Tax=Actinoplanes sp. NPDC051343 TaxID=3363906 RepID=UPI0037B50274